MAESLRNTDDWIEFNIAQSNSGLAFSRLVCKNLQVCSLHPPSRWVLAAALPEINPIQLPNGASGSQPACMHICNLSSAFLGDSAITKFQNYLAVKLSITSKSRNVKFTPVQLVNNRFHTLHNVLESLNPFVRFCWLRTVCGGWTTSIRMHAEVSFSQCVFACPCSEDVLTHYLQCPVLWCLAREISGINELSCSIDARLSLAEPRPDQLILFAFCHSIYHTCLHDRECVSLSLAGNQASLHRRVVSFGRQLRHLIVR